LLIKKASLLNKKLRMKKIWLKRVRSFKEAQDFDENYYLKASGIERLETVQYLREMYFKIRGVTKHEGRERLRRVIKIIQ